MSHIFQIITLQITVVQTASMVGIYLFDWMKHKWCETVMSTALVMCCNCVVI